MISLLDILFGKEIFFYDPRVRPGWAEGEYIIQILKYRPRKKKHPKFAVALADTNPVRLLRKAKDFCDCKNK